MNGECLDSEWKWTDIWTGVYWIRSRPLAPCLQTATAGLSQRGSGWSFDVHSPGVVVSVRRASSSGSRHSGNGAQGALVKGLDSVD
jgi:hypothetical protein